MVMSILLQSASHMNFKFTSFTESSNGHVNPLTKCSQMNFKFTSNTENSNGHVNPLTKCFTNEI